MREVIFIEGINRAGKDWFMDESVKYFPNVNMYYSPRANFEHYPRPAETSWITFNTTFTSILKNSPGKPSFIYRSPITDMVYNDFFGRKRADDDLAKLLKDFSTKVSCSAIFLKPCYEILQSRQCEWSMTQCDTLMEKYLEYFKDFAIPLTVCDSFDHYIGKIRAIVDKLPNNVALIDVDDTLYQYEKSLRKTHKFSKMVELEKSFSTIPANFEKVYLSGMSHPEITGLIESPLAPLKSSFSFKYSLIKILAEETEKKFILVDDYLPLLAKLADDLELNTYIESREKKTWSITNVDHSII
jgi:hypothetical protein